MTWMQYGATFYELGSEDPGKITKEDIARSLAKINRFTGHSNEPISVARHSIYVSKLLDIHPAFAMHGLVHDIGETVVNDLSWAVKTALPSSAREAIADIEHKAQRALLKVLKIQPLSGSKDIGFDAVIMARVKEADWAAVAAEKRDLLKDCDRSWDMLPYPAASVKAHATETWEDDAYYWLYRYEELYPKYIEWWSDQH